MKIHNALPKYEYIDALRGYAILAVIVVHSAGAIPPTDGWVMRLIEQGARGVQLFYVVSALTLSMSWSFRKDGYISFLVRRFFRIVPLFYLAIPVYLLFAGFGPGYFAPPDTSLEGIARALFFIDGFYPSKWTVVPGGLTVCTEIVFYMLFPLFVFAARSLRASFVMYIVSFVFSVTILHDVVPFIYLENSKIAYNDFYAWAQFSLPVQLPLFMSGIFVYYLLGSKVVVRPVGLNFLLVVSLALMLIIPFSKITAPFMLIYSIPFVLLVYCLGRGAGGFLVNLPMICLGKVSFSAYIWHFLVLDIIYLGKDHGLDFFGMNTPSTYYKFLCLLIAVVAVTYAIAFASYRLVEQPFIGLGKLVAERYVRQWTPKREVHREILGKAALALRKK